MKRKKWLTISMLLFVLAFFLIMTSVKNITGFAILDSSRPILAPLGIFILMIAIIAYGLSMMAAPVAVAEEKEGGLVRKVRGVGFFKRGEEVYMTDPTRVLSHTGSISLWAYKAKLADADDEKKEAIKGVFLEPLLELRKMGLIPNTAGYYADMFVRPLLRDGAESLDKPEERRLTSEQRREIVTSFRNWDGRVRPEQTDLLRKYNLAYEEKGNKKHAKIYRIEDPNEQIPVTGSPGDKRTGLNTAREIIHLLEGLYSHKLPRDKEKD